MTMKLSGCNRPGNFFLHKGAAKHGFENKSTAQ